MLRHAVELILDVDVPDAAIARALTVRLLPTVAPQLVVHYRAPMETDRGKPSRLRHIMAGVQSHLVSKRPSGPIGTMVATLKQGAAVLLIGGAGEAFTDARIDLGDLFGAPEISLLEEQLAEADGITERVTIFQEFLAVRLRDRAADPLTQHAAQALRQMPSQSIRLLASRLDVSERHLARRFRATVGTRPKHFARIARLGHVFAQRRSGAAWADIAFSCGFNDQAHMIKEFSAMMGCSPDAFFRAAPRIQRPEEHVGLMYEGIPAQPSTGPGPSRAG
jgi:AraC-like DNA-binding protein